MNASVTYRRRYVITERAQEREGTPVLWRKTPPVCFMDDCSTLATHDCSFDMIQRSGGVNAGSPTPLCGAHSIDWLRWSL